MTSMLVMAKTPFPRKHSGSVDEDEEEEDFEDVFSPPPPQSRQKQHSSRHAENFSASENARHVSASSNRSFDKDQIEIKKVSNALPVVNKMSQQIYADHQSQAPAKGMCEIVLFKIVLLEK